MDDGKHLGAAEKVVLLWRRGDKESDENLNKKWEYGRQLNILERFKKYLDDYQRIIEEKKRQVHGKRSQKWKLFLFLEARDMCCCPMTWCG